jgi:hypothetical protein
LRAHGDGRKFAISPNAGNCGIKIGSLIKRFYFCLIGEKLVDGVCSYQFQKFITETIDAK